jgi:hypothetical protein
VKPSPWLDDNKYPKTLTLKSMSLVASVLSTPRVLFAMGTMLFQETAEFTTFELNLCSFFFLSSKF